MITLAILTAINITVSALGAAALTVHYRRETAYARSVKKIAR